MAKINAVKRVFKYIILFHSFQWFLEILVLFISLYLILEQFSYFCVLVFLFIFLRKLNYTLCCKYLSPLAL